ncbi:hypothetical protein Acsp05_47290 [Actinokineospora sp. NBRC 105648]|nr:hypothetical protein Acsp05_47290 [Actinokineospora sp. NBRC 105648]
MLALALAGCAEGTSQTDREADTIALAVSYPRQSSAAGFARAVLGSPPAPSSERAILEMRELDARAPQDPLAHLVFRIHHDGVESGWSKTDPVTACYAADFNYYGAIGEPKRVDCPENAVPIIPPEYPAWSRPEVFDRALDTVLRTLPVPADQRAVIAMLSRADLIEPQADTDNPVPRDPAVDVVATPDEVGVSFHGADGTCLLGSRLRTDIRTWRPAATVPCTAQAAAQRQGVTP